MNSIWCDPAYDDSKPYESAKNNAMRLICPVKKYHSTPPNRTKLTGFCNSAVGRKLYSQRKISIEALFETIKDTFSIRTVLVKGLENI